ncbi:MAG: C4-dicarboxylate ABC transporter substrate-binding protein [Betaproteobacteria bacterium]|nr:C4-dicarboxylate ABC transporter substrate-binding protein [Betaproteobacteria bacterium]MDH3437532.1 C4-dicarboxylate ABC transporter substrate-binding protein [Betaproteobacteria bacterium]
MSTDPLSRKNFLERWLLRLFHSGSETEEVAFREFVLVAAVALLIIGLAFWIAFRFVRPAPPHDFVMSTGSDSGAYHAYGERYSELLARDKLKVTVRTSSGSVENLRRLADDKSGVSVAFVQGGVGNATEYPNLVTLAALYYEPLWVFYRGERELTLLSALVDKRVAIGPEGSGTRALALALAAASKITDRAKSFLPLGGAEAAAALIKGEVDAALFVAGPDAPVVQQLLRAEGVRLMSLDHAEALSRRFPYLARVSLPRGGIDIADDIPPREVTLVATTAYLVARDDFHPALVSVLLQAVARVHRVGGVFYRPGEFPAARDGDFPLSEDARRYFTSGPPFLQRYMPFWVANLIQRLLVLLVPLIAVVIPVMRIFPGVYKWRVRRRVFRWYHALRAVEAETAKNPAPERARELLVQIDTIQDGVSRTRVPLAYSDYAYNLKLHIDMVRTQLERRARSGT